MWGILYTLNLWHLIYLHRKHGKMMIDHWVLGVPNFQLNPLIAIFSGAIALQTAVGTSCRADYFYHQYHYMFWIHLDYLHPLVN